MFKPYVQNQDFLIPPSWDDKIHKDHPVRIVNRVIDSLDLKALYDSYNNIGPSPYDPKMLLKAIVFAYLNNVYSSRKIEYQIKSNIHFIWLCANSEPDHNTINRFRGKRLSKFLKNIFKEIVLMLAEQGIINIKEIYVDGTKMEANANRYTFVWGKSVARNKKKMLERIDELWSYAQNVAKVEMEDTATIDYEKVSPEVIAETIKRIEEALKDKEIPKEIKKKLKTAKKEYPSRLAEYQLKEEILEGRNSYSKTDHDATFMRMKDDKMQNKELKAAYNIQISTNNQFIVNYDIYQNPGDTLTLPSHLETYKDLYSFSPATVIADAGYGSEQNYEYLESNEIESYVKYNYFHQEEKGIRQRKQPFSAGYLYYNELADYYVCPMGQKMHTIGASKKKNESGYEQSITRYQADNCTGCPLLGPCHKSKGNRVIEINKRLRKLKQNARENLLSEEGIKKRKQRSVDVEPVFGNIKQNKGFRRFMLRGSKKVTTEFGLLAIAHNLKKFCA